MKRLITVIIIFLGVSLSYAKWSFQPGVNAPVCTAQFEQTNPSAATDGKGGAIIAWQDSRNGGEYDIYAQRIDPHGNLLWAPNGIAICTAPDEQYNPIVITDSNGGAYIVWRDARNSLQSTSTDTDVYMQHVDSAGNISWEANGIPVCVADASKDGLVAAADGFGGVFVAWRDWRTCARLTSNQRGGTCLYQFKTTSIPHIYIQHVSTSGKLLNDSTVGVLSCDTAHPASQSFPQLVADGSGGTFLVWQDNFAQSGAITCQHFTSYGTMQLPNTGSAVCGIASLKNNLAAVSDGAGGFIAAWDDSRNIQSTGADIYAQRIFANGKLAWSYASVPVSTYNQDQLFPQIAPDMQGGAFIIWQDHRNYYVPPNYYGADLYGQHLHASDGSPLWTMNGAIVASAPQDQFGEQVISDDSGGAYVVWVDNRATNTSMETDYTDTHIYGKRLRADSTVVWGGGTGMPICTAQNNQNALAAIRCNAGILSVWSDGRNSAKGNEQGDIYAQWTLPEGFSTLKIFRDTINFGILLPGGTKTDSFSLQNIFVPNGMNIDSAISSDPFHFTVAVQPTPLLMGDTTNISVVFTPDSIRAYSGYIFVYNSIAAAPDTVYVNGLGAGPIFAANKDSINFGSVKDGKSDVESFTIFNKGNQPLEIYSMALSDYSDFSLSRYSDTLAQSDSANIVVTFKPSVAHVFHEHITIISNAETSPDTIMLFGTGLASGVAEHDISTAFALEQNYPNPFTDETTINYTLQSTENVTLIITDMLGREVKLFDVGIQSQGTHTAIFHGTGLPEGVYTCILKASAASVVSRTENLTRKMLLVR